MNDKIAGELQGWIPYKLVETPGNVHCRWLYTGQEKFTEPFFDDTISKCRGLSFNQQMQYCCSDLSVLPEWAATIRSAPPALLIFHVSRCGSTLLSQLFSLDPENIVLSEVPFLDALFRYGRRTNTEDALSPILKAAVELYGMCRHEESKRTIIKADSWHIHFFEQIRKIYPGVPCVLLYRRPDEVIRSQQKRRGMQAVPGLIEPEIFGFSKETILQLDLDTYMARVLETYFEAFIRMASSDPLCLPVNYASGGMEMVNSIARFAGIPINPDLLRQMEERNRFHGKYPHEVFEEEQLNDEIPAYLKKSFTLYRELESIRNEKQ